MSVAQVQTFLALCTLSVNVLTVVVAAAVLARRTGPGAMVLAWFAPLALPSAWLVATSAMAGSLWFSEHVGYVPCELCWFQRAAIFPLPFLLGPMMWRRDRAAARYLWPVLAVGSSVSLWHWLVERVPGLAASTSCAIDVPCTVPWFTEFGFVTLAWMALSTQAFVAVGVLAANVGDRRAVGPAV